MSREQLFKPPRLSLRTGTIGVAVVGGLGIVIEALLAAADIREPLEAARHAAVLAMTGLACWLVFRWLRRRAERTRPERMPFINLGIALNFLACFYLGAGVVSHGSPWSLIASYLWMFPLLSGLMLIQTGMTRRVGDSLHCPSCEYEYNFPDPADAPARCPECGHGWLDQLKKGRRHKSSKLIAAGAIIAISSFTVFQPVFVLRPLAPYLPTPVLYAVLYVSPQNGFSAWKELAGRPLADPWNRIMAERVMASRRHGAFRTSESQWFEIVSATGAFQDDTLEQYYRESFVAELRAPASARPGEVILVALRSRHAAQGFGHNLGVYFAGYTLGASSAALGRRDQTAWAHDLSSVSFLKRPRDVFEQSIQMPGEPGPLTLHATYWVVHLPSFWERLKWQPDGTPERPAGALWFERIDIEQSIQVEP